MKRIVKFLAVVSMFFICIQPITVSADWKQNDTGWWYELPDGSYYVNTFAEINEKLYCFDEKGYMYTGWHVRPDSGDMALYYFTPSGALGSCQWVGNQWVNWYGALERSMWVDSYKYYVDENGNWNSMPPDNTMWKKDANGWWFDLADGTYAIDGFYEIDGNMYVFDEKGYMRTGWYQDEYDFWYYLGNDGAVRRNQWYDGYYLDLYGTMAFSRWLYNQTMYVDRNGKKSAGWQKDATGWWFDLGADGYLKNAAYIIGSKSYQFDENGYMVTGWYSPDGGNIWCFYQSDGSGKKNAWEGNYWLDHNGIMARDQWVDGGKYYVGSDGAWVPGKKP